MEKIEMITISGIKKIESLLEEFKPTAEEVSGLKLSDVVVSCREYPNKRWLFVYDPPNSITINPKSNYVSFLIDSESGLPELKYYILHELGHHIFHTINPELINNKIEYTLIDEGFAEYFSLDLTPNGILSEDTIRSRKGILSNIFDIEYLRYIQGYDFFSKVTKAFGKEEAFNIIKKPKIMHTEILFPELYILRKKIMHKLGRKNGNLQKK